MVESLTEYFDVSVWDEVVAKLRPLNTKYREFLTPFREMCNKRKPYIDKLETLVKGTDFDLETLKMLQVEHITYNNWKLYWESPIRFIQVFTVATNKVVKGEVIDLKSIFTKDISSLLGITDFSYMEGPPSYNRLVIVKDPKYDTNVTGTISNILTWNKTNWLNTKGLVLRMLDLANYNTWDEVGNIINVTCDYITVNAKKNVRDPNMLIRFYNTLFLIEFCTDLYRLMDKLLQHWIRVGTSIVISKK